MLLTRIYIYIKEKIISKILIFYFRLVYFSRLKVEKGLFVRRRFKIKIELQGHIKIGENVFFNNDCSLNSMGLIDIGSNCLFGESVKIYDHNHRFSSMEKNIIDQGYSIGSVKIGNNCWLGSNVTILKDVIIGDGCIIGANCVIKTGTIIPDNSIVQQSSELEVTKREHRQQQ